MQSRLEKGTAPAARERIEGVFSLGAVKVSRLL
jgi:hypothetical protein